VRGFCLCTCRYMWMVGNALIFVVAQLYEKHAISTSDQVTPYNTSAQHEDTKHHKRMQPHATAQVPGQRTDTRITKTRIPKP
jgi:hypothetical protein